MLSCFSWRILLCRTFIFPNVVKYNSKIDAVFIKTGETVSVSTKKIYQFVLKSKTTAYFSVAA